MSGTISTINTPLIGAGGFSSPTLPGSMGGDGQSVAEGTGSPYSNQDFSSFAGALDLTPQALGGGGGGGAGGAAGASGQATTTHTTDRAGNTLTATTWTSGSSGGAAGAGGAGGAATLLLQSDRIGAAGSSFRASPVQVAATAAGGEGGGGATGGASGSGGYNLQSITQNGGTTATQTSQGAAGGNGGDGGDAGDGGAAYTGIANWTAYTGLGAIFSVSAVGGAGGLTSAISGWAGASGGTASVGGDGGNAGSGGDATAVLANSKLADDFSLSVTLSALGGAGGAGGNGGNGGAALSSFYPGLPNTVDQFGANGNGGNGGNGGAAAARLSGNSLAAPSISIALTVGQGAGGAGGAGGNEGAPVTTATQRITVSLPGTTGTAGSAGSGQITFTNNTIAVGSGISGDSQHGTTNGLTLQLEIDGFSGPGTASAPVALSAAPNANLQFFGNIIAGNGTSQLNLLQQGGGTAVVDTAASTLSLDGSPANQLTGFDYFYLGNNSTFVTGAGSYTVSFAPDADTLVYTPASGNVTLQGVTGSNMLLEFQGFGASLTAAEVQAATTVSNGNSFVALPNGHTIELAGFTGGIPAADIAFTAPCFLEGTRIATPRGPIAVENLAAGDIVLAQFGGAAAIRWVGHRRVDCRAHPLPRAVWPVRIAAHAFGPDAPRRAVWLSPDHAVFIGNVLIPVRYLINGRTIAQEPLRSVRYFHVQLDRHDVLSADGLPCESFLDTGNRADFDNGGGVARLHPAFALRIWNTDACARLVLGGPELAAARRALLDRAEALGHVQTDDPHLQILSGGLLLQPNVLGRLHRVRLPAGARGVRLLSRAGVPAELHEDRGDTRRLGIAISRIAYGDQPIRLASPRLGAGWHAVERSRRATWRWTDGDATLDVPGGQILMFQVAQTERYWRDDAIGGQQAAAGR